TADTAMPGAFRSYFVVTIPGQSPVAYPADGITVTIYPSVGALTGPQEGPCFPWTTADRVRSLVPGIDPAMDLTDWVEAGSEIMWALTGRQFDGLCSATVRPSHQSCSVGGIARRTRGAGPPWGGSGATEGCCGWVLRASPGSWQDPRRCDASPRSTWATRPGRSRASRSTGQRLTPPPGGSTPGAG